MSEIPKFFLLLGSGLLLSASVAFAQGPPKLKAPIRVNLLQQSMETKQSKALAERLRPQDQLRLPDDRGFDGGILGQDKLPDFSKGDIVDEEPLDMENKEDFLNPEFLQPIDGADAFRNEQLEALRGDLELEGEEGDLSEDEERQQDKRREMMRELAGQSDPFEFLETKGALVEPKRGPPSSDSKSLNGGDEPVDRNNRAAANINMRDAEKSDSSYGSDDEGIGKPANAKGETRAFANANTGSLVDGLIRKNRENLSMLDSINQKYGFSAADRAAPADNSRSRMRRAFEERADGSVGWRSDLRPPERDRRVDALAPTLERGGGRSGLGGLGGLASFTGGGSPGADTGRSSALRLPGTSLSTSGPDSSVGTLRIGAGSKSRNSRSRSTLPGGSPAPRSNSRGFDLGTGFGSSFDNSPIKSPFKF